MLPGEEHVKSSFGLAECPKLQDVVGEMSLVSDWKDWTRNRRQQPRKQTCFFHGKHVVFMKQHETTCFFKKQNMVWRCKVPSDACGVSKRCGQDTYD